MKPVEERGGLDLLDHAFITANSNKNVDKNFIQRIINEIENDENE